MEGTRTDGLVVRVHGKLCGSLARDAQHALTKATARAPRRVLVDLRHCAAIDSLGLEALGALAGARDVVVFGATWPVCAQLEILGLPPGVRLASRPDAWRMLTEPAPGQLERRKYYRVAISFPAELRWRSSLGALGRVWGSTRDLSKNGLGLAVTGGEDLALAEIASGEVSDVDVRVGALFGSQRLHGRVVAHDDGAAGPSGHTLGLELLELGRDVCGFIRKVVAAA